MKNGILCGLTLICCICNVGFGQAIIEKVPAVGTTMRFECMQLDHWKMNELRYAMIVSRGDKSAVSDLPCIEVRFEHPNPMNNTKYRLEVHEEDERLTLATLKQYKRIGEPLTLEKVPSESDVFRSFENYLFGKTDSAVVRKEMGNTKVSLHDSPDGSRTVFSSVNDDDVTPFGAGRLFVRHYSAQGTTTVKIVACGEVSEPSVAR